MGFVTFAGFLWLYSMLYGGQTPILRRFLRYPMETQIDKLDKNPTPVTAVGVANRGWRLTWPGCI